MLTTHTPPPREAAPRRAQQEAAASPVLDPTSWQKILQIVRTQHPSLNRSWFDQLAPRQLNNGGLQVNVATPAQLMFCQSQCQQPFTQAAEVICARLVAVSFHCENLPSGGVFNDQDQPLILSPD